jgi:hypothetical protein
VKSPYRLRIQAAGRFTPPAGQLTEHERTMVFRAVQAVIEADGFLAQPGADLLVNLRTELNLEDPRFETMLSTELTPEELTENPISTVARDYLCYMMLLAGYADGAITEGERRVIDKMIASLHIRPERCEEIRAACLRAILEANLLMNLSEVIAESALARRYCEELGLPSEALDSVADTILQSLAEA